MSLSKEAQFLELAKRSKNPLILLPPYPTIDALASGYALAHFLEALGQSPTVGSDHLSEKRALVNFLQSPKQLLNAISGARDFVLSFNTEHNPILDVRTERLEKELRIALTPEHGTIDPRDFSFILAQYKYDLVITLGVPDKESLGKMYEDNPDLFFEIPIINIDHQSGNEHFGQLNLVEVTASSNAEIIALLLDTAAKEFLSPVIAEALLTGIIAATESFQKKNTTPRALEIASRLMGYGADQQKIVRNLYKTQPLHLLKLWGRIMGNVHFEEKEKLIWAVVSLEDLVQSRSRMDDLIPALDKLRGSFASATTFALFFQETRETLRVYLKTSEEEYLKQLLTVFSGGQLIDNVLVGTLSGSTPDMTLRLLRDWLASIPSH